MNYDNVEILFAEDSIDDATLTTRALTKSGFTNRLHHVKDGAEALDFLYCKNAYASRNQESKPKLLLLDLKMPKVSGMQVLEKVSLSDRSHHKPNEMSGGQNQRVAIARALVNDPAMILADEPTGNLDSKTSHEIMEIFEKIHDGGNTVILVTHEEDIANFAHRIVRLRDGVIESDRKKIREKVH